MAECREYPIPLAAGKKLQQNSEGTEGTDLVDQKLYQEAVGTLTYSAITMCPDVAYTSGLVGGYAGAPSTLHWKAINRILHYLKETKEVRLHLGIVSEARGQGSGIEVFADSDFAAEVDTMKPTMAIANLSSSCYKPSTRHVGVRYFWLRELVENREIQLESVVTRDMVADGFTKGLEQVKHKIFLSMLSMY
jgi:hypothetical protein